MVLFERLIASQLALTLRKIEKPVLTPLEGLESYKQIMIEDSKSLRFDINMMAETCRVFFDCAHEAVSRGDRKQVRELGSFLIAVGFAEPGHPEQKFPSIWKDMTNLFRKSLDDEWRESSKGMATPEKPLVESEDELSKKTEWVIDGLEEEHALDATT